MKNFYFTLIILFGLGVIFVHKACAQKRVSSFDSIYVYIATTLSVLDIHNNLQDANYLVNNSKDIDQEMKSLMLLATQKRRVREKAETLDYALKEEDMVKKNQNDEWQIRISGFLATTFREVDLIEEGK